MGYKLKKEVPLKDILSFIEYECDISDNVKVLEIAPVSGAGSSCLCFSSTLLERDEGAIVFLKENIVIPENTSNLYLSSANPRLDFIKALDFLYTRIGFSHFDFPSQIHPSVKIGKNVVIENGCRIEEGVILEHNVVIHSGTIIGKNSRIRANASIGGDGFGFERLERGLPIRFQHLGGVEIGENVEVGSNTCIARGTLSNTVIKNNVKIDNLVHIAHNCVIGEGAMITACAEVSGGVVIGDNAWVGPNAAIIQKLSIGEEALVGIGAVVTKNVDTGSVYAGNPAKFLRKL